MYSVFLLFLMKRYKIGIWNSDRLKADTLGKKPKPFKKCSVCGISWSDRDDFLSDPNVIIAGYQVHFNDLDKGLFLFNHDCGTTLAIFTGEFIDLYDGSFLTGSKFGTDECPEYCLRQEELSLCPVKCECAYVRDILQIIRKWPKQSLEKGKKIPRVG